MNRQTVTNSHPVTPRRRATVGFALSASLSVVAATLGAGLSAQAATKPPSGYRVFSSCEKFLGYIRPIALEQVGPYGFGGQTIVRRSGEPLPPPGVATPVAPAPVEEAAQSAPGAKASDTSTTNTQEVGVDEGDIVETDGRYVYAAVNQQVIITDVTTGKVVAAVRTPTNSGPAQLILDGPRLAVTNQVWSNLGGETVISVYDVSNPANPVLFNTTHLEGNVLAVRSVDNRVRLVLSTTFGQRVQQQFPQPGPINTPEQAKKATEANKKIVRTAPAGDWLPRRYSVRPDGKRTEIVNALPCNQVGRPADASGLGLTWVATIDLNVPDPSPTVRGSTGVVANAGIVYASPDTLYVATQQWSNPQRSNQSQSNSAKVTTEVHAFDLKARDGGRWLASGRFNGTLLNQFSMSEHDGAFRVATTRFDAGFGGTTESGVQILMLDRSDNRKLKVVGELWGLGTNERVYSVRFVGTTGYVVTFRQIDPLYVLDLSNRQAPVLRGELKIPGYSSYLHPIGDGLLLGIGQDATEQGRTTGAQLSLFDVNDPANPKRLATAPVGNNSVAEYDHRAFLWWPASRDVFLPTVSYQPNKYSAGVVVTRVGDRASATMNTRGSLTHRDRQPSGPGSTVVPVPVPGEPATPPIARPRPPVVPILRTLIVSGEVVTVSEDGLLVSDLAGLADRRWVAFPK
jgi:uncharacterized secreted protein with C-terminal beta-propeller domain